MKSPETSAPAAHFHHIVRVYWEDTDAGGIVFYANYLKFMERARTEWLRSLGVEQRSLRESSGGQFVVSETQLKYHRPARLDDELAVTAELRQIGQASLTIDQRVLFKSQPGTLLCEGMIRIGWVDAATLRPTRMPKDISGTLERHQRSIA
jgi:acyl-CoA thioester hydrolase